MLMWDDSQLVFSILLFHLSIVGKFQIFMFSFFSEIFTKDASYITLCLVLDQSYGLINIKRTFNLLMSRNTNCIQVLNLKSLGNFPSFAVFHVEGSSFYLI